MSNNKIQKVSIRFFNDREVRAVLKKEGNEVVSATNQLKLLATDGKRRLTDVLDTNGILQLAACFPNTKASRFVAWLTNSEESINGKSKSKAYALFESSMIKCIDWSMVNKKDYLEAMTASVADSTPIKQILGAALTDKINDRETFMKGIDYSYYYEQDD